MDEKYKIKSQQDERHDWLADAGVAFMAYYFTKNGFQVFGENKWGPDLLLINRKNKKQYFVEVKTQEQERRNKYRLKQLKKSDFLAEVIFPNQEPIKIKLFILKDGKKGSEITIENLA